MSEWTRNFATCLLTILCVTLAASIYDQSYKPTGLYLHIKRDTSLSDNVVLLSPPMAANAGALRRKPPPTESKNDDTIFHELGYWFLYSLLLGLAQIWLIPISSYLFLKPFTLVEVIGNGSLLFFATTTVSTTAGEYFRRVKTHHSSLTLLCIGGLFVIVTPSIFAYGVEIASHIGVAGIPALSPERMTTVSLLLAAAGLIFSLVFTIVNRQYSR